MIKSCYCNYYILNMKKGEAVYKNRKLIFLN